MSTTLALESLLTTVKFLLSKLCVGVSISVYVCVSVYIKYPKHVPLYKYVVITTF